MPVSIWEFVAIAVCLVGCAFFSGSETAITAYGEARTRATAEAGGRSAWGFRLWRDHPARVLSTLLVGNTLVNIAAASLATDIALKLGVHNAVGVATGIMTFLILTFGEITPKSFAKQHAGVIAPVVMPAIGVLYYVLFPVNFAFVEVPRLVARAASSLAAPAVRAAGAPAAPSVTSDEIEYLVRVGAREGALDKVRGELLRSVLEFHDIRVKEVMTPRTQIVALEATSAPAEVLRVVVDSEHSRIPVYEGSVDRIVGVLHAKDLLAEMERAGAPKDFPLGRLVRPAFFVPEQMQVSGLLREFQRRKTHLAVVVDEYGGTSGIVTLEDVLEQIVGEIHDEHDTEEKPVKALSDGVLLADASVPLRELEQVLKVDLPHDGDYETLGGMLIARSGRVPTEGSVVVSDGFVFKVRGSDERRVTLVEIARAPEPAEPAAGGAHG